MAVDAASLEIDDGQAGRDLWDAGQERASIQALRLQRREDRGVGQEDPAREALLFEDDAARGAVFVGDAAPDPGAAVAPGADRDDAGGVVTPEEEASGVHDAWGWGGSFCALFDGHL